MPHRPPTENDDGARHDQDRAHDSPRGLVIAVGGVGGLDFCGIALCYVAAKTRLPHAIELVPWGHGFGRWHADLTNVANRDAKARLIAEIVARHKIARLDSPIFLVAKSGGAGVAIKALELMAQQAVERVVLLAPALSPQYDLTAALEAVHKEIVVFWSPLDVLILGAGTRLFGTMDRVRTASAGLVGFQTPPEEHANGPYRKLRHVRWRPRMMTTGYFGGHWGPDSPWFLRRYVLPLLNVESNTPS
jgi:hypothetical protein